MSETYSNTLSVLRVNPRASLIAVAALLLSSTSVLSASPVWTGAVGSSWFESGNWDGGLIPGATDIVSIDSVVPLVIDGQAVTVDWIDIGTGTAATSVTLLGGATLNVNTLQIAPNADGNAALKISGEGSRLVAVNGGNVGYGTDAVTSITVENGGAFETVSGGLYLDNGAIATVTGEGSQLLIGTLHSGIPLNWSAADGWFTASDATVSVSDGAYAQVDGLYLQGGSTGDAVMAVSGPHTVVDAQLLIYIGGNGNGIPEGHGSLQVSDGATISGASIYVGVDSDTSGYLLLTGADTRMYTVLRPDNTAGNFGVGFNGDGVAVVQDGATLAVLNTAYIAYNAGSNGKLVIGAEEGQAAAAPGTVTAGGGVVFGDGNGELVFNHTSTNYIFAPDISGDGTIKAIAGTTTLSGDSSAFTGTISVTGGVLNIAGAISAVSTIESGGKLTGSGTVGGVDALSGSFIAPGNSPGTLTVSGQYNQASGSTYLAEIVPGGAVSDMIAITGTANLDSGALLSVSAYGSGNFVLGTRYTILSAAGGLTGVYTISGSTDLSAFYAVDVNYDSNNVYLDVVQSQSFASAALTPNQIATATALDGVSPTSDLVSAIGSSATEDAARFGFDQLSGEIHASAKTALLDDSRFIRDATARQLRNEARSESNAIWMQGYGTWASVDGNGNAAGFDRNAGGFFIGADGELFDAMRVGVVGGYGHASLSSDSGRGSISIDSYSLGLYGGEQWSRLNFSFGFNHTWHQLSSQRAVALSAFSESLEADYDGRTMQAYGDIGYKIDLSEASLEPFAGIAYVNLRTDDFVETGGEAALAGRGDTTDTTFTTLGLRASRKFDLQGNRMQANAMVGWRHALQDSTPTTANSFAGGADFSVAGVPLARDVAAIEVGLAAEITSNARFGLSYTGQLGSGVSDHGLKASLNLRF